MKFNLNAENVNYLKIIYNDENEFSHCIKTAIKNISTKDIDASAKYDETLHIKYPQKVELHFATDGGLYKAISDLKYAQIKDSYINFIISIPDNMEYQQNREYFRVKLTENALLTFDIGDLHHEVSCETFDISANGVRVILEENIKFPEYANIVLFLPSRKINAQVKYVRTDEEDGILKASFSFVNLLEADQDYISQMCIRKQIETRRKNLL